MDVKLKVILYLDIFQWKKTINITGIPSEYLDIPNDTGHVAVNKRLSFYLETARFLSILLASFTISFVISWEKNCVTLLATLKHWICLT